MASLADLFVTYKNVEPVKEEDTEETKESPSESYTRILQELQDLRERVAWLGGAMSNQPGVSAPESGAPEPETPETPETPASDDKKTEKLGSRTKSKIGTKSGSGNGSSSVVSTTYSAGKLAEEIGKLFEEQGIKARITSGYDPNRTNATSYHKTGNAVDIVPTDGDYEALLESLATNDVIKKFFEDNELGYFDERTNIFHSDDWTGSHIHIGPDKAAVPYWKALLEKYDTASNDDETEESDETSEVGDLSKKQKRDVERMYGMIKFAINDHNNEGFHPYTSEYADKLARWYTAQWATDNDFSDKFKMKDYWSSLYLDSLSSDKRVNQYINDLVAQNGQLNFGGSLKRFLDNISGGDESYKTSFNSNLKMINKYLDAIQSNRQGGLFTNIRELYGKSFSQYR